ncbi:transcriptional regulator, MucR family [Desulfonatronum thiosulfatophilum]|uniref:Transcriptional regulator, MucR family n=1 Tax=Desulfonatronum thiosulfatophilum TaxID=617002 RepID=A0A1G6EWC5_9BACT|nr:MucR family transcriptional regulator [Desulfonatronum thiosulfatophilum]SDB61760.1 transcriptional regulator, MucR family [Desulfonatronum thiosulfatophilum]
MDDYVKQALEIVKAQASIRAMTEEEMMSMVTNLAASLRGVVVNDPVTMVDSHLESTGDPKKAIKERSVTCMECGKNFKVLTKKHLATHDLTPEEYREKWGYKKGTALIAKALSKARKKKMQEMQLWKKKGVKRG